MTPSPDVTQLICVPSSSPLLISNDEEEKSGVLGT